MKNYRSSIPKGAQERVASNYISTKRKLKRGFPQYWVNNIRVTKRQYLRA
jgi:hypothetical protein